MRVDRERRVVRQHQRVAVGGLLRGELVADVAARPGAVLDHHRLAGQLGELLAEDAAEDVARAARRKRRDEADRLRRIALRRREVGEDNEGEEQKPHARGV